MCVASSGPWQDEFSKGKEWRLYDYVTRHFIASLMDDAEYDETPDGNSVRSHATTSCNKHLKPKRLCCIAGLVPIGCAPRVPVAEDTLRF